MKRRSCFYYTLMLVSLVSPAPKWAGDRRAGSKSKSPVACFSSGRRAIYNSQLATLDVQFRKLCRSIVGPPPGVDWNAAWNEVLHLWNERVRNFIANGHVNTWSYITC